MMLFLLIRERIKLSLRRKGDKYLEQVQTLIFYCWFIIFDKYKTIYKNRDGLVSFFENEKLLNTLF